MLPASVLPEGLAVVRQQHDQRILVQAAAPQRLHQAAEAGVVEGDLLVVAAHHLAASGLGERPLARSCSSAARFSAPLNPWAAPTLVVFALLAQGWNV